MGIRLERHCTVDTSEYCTEAVMYIGLGLGGERGQKIMACPARVAMAGLENI